MQCLCVSVFVQSLSPVSHNNLSQINNFLRGLPKCNLISNRSPDILGLLSRYSWLEMNPLSWSFRIITYLLAVLLFNVTIVLTSWLLQIARILLNFSFNFKYINIDQGNNRPSAWRNGDMLGTLQKWCKQQPFHCSHNKCSTWIGYFKSRRYCWLRICITC